MCALELTCGLVQRVLIARAERDRCAFRRKKLGCCTADAARSTGDDGNLSFE